MCVEGLDLRITYLCAHCGQFAEVSFWAVEVFDSGTTLTCDKCGEDTVFDLSTPKGRAAEFQRAKELEETVEMFQDKDFFDVLAQAVIDQLRWERDEARAALRDVVQGIGGLLYG